MKSIFDTVSVDCSKLTTKTYSTSFSLGIYFIDKSLRNDIYSIYGFVRFADEIVDSFDGYNKAYLLQKFKDDTYEAIREGISLNPILNAFQQVVRNNNVEKELIETFLNSMEMDLDQTAHTRESYDRYILGSAEVVGLMCLRVFTNGSSSEYEKLKPYAMKLGAAFQKVNFLRDLEADFQHLGRSYFPNIDLTNFNTDSKKEIEAEIEAEFAEALKGIKMLPSTSKAGVYLAYVYYTALFRKIKRHPSEKIMNNRIRISNSKKVALMAKSMFQFKLNLI